MKLLGIDVGLTKQNPVGLAFVSDQPVALLWSGTVLSRKDDWNDRLGDIAQDIDRILADLSPDGVVYELPHMQKNPQVTSKLAHVCGIVVACCALRHIPYVGVQPLQAKRAWTGNPQASKQEMMDQAELVFRQKLVKDVADACGVAWYGMGYFQNKELLNDPSNQTHD